VAAAGYHGVSVWDGWSGEEFLELQGRSASLAFSPTEPVIAIGRPGLRLWDLQTGSERVPSEGFGQVGGIAFGPDGHLAAGGPAGFVRIYENGRVWSAHQLDLDDDSLVAGVAFSPDSRYLAAANLRQKAVVWDTVTGWQRSLPGAGSCVAFSPD